MGSGDARVQREVRIAGRIGLVGLMALAGAVSLDAFHASAVAAPDPVIAAAGDYGCDPLDADYDDLNGTSDGRQCQQKATSNLLVDGNFRAVLALGDQHYCGSLAEYQQAYDPTWGRVKSITHPIPGNHEYLTSGGSTPTTGCDSSNAGAAGYFNYFGAAAGNPGQGWYSYDIGAWHLIALNSNCTDAGGCIPSSPQGLFLAADLAAHSNQCILAYWHIPLFSSGGRAAQNGYWLWKQLYAAHADVVLDGHDHIYERFDPQDADGLADPNGIREFIVGTGGANHTSIAAVAANSEVRDTTTFGVLALTLHAGAYSWSFEPARGTFTDSGSASCHNAGSTPSPSPGVSPSLSPGVSPSLSPSPTPGGSATFPAAADSYVDASAPTATHGTLTSLRVDASPVVRSYLRFNVTGLTGAVGGATLRVWANTAQATGYDAYSVADNTWAEMTITAANAPPFGQTRLGSSGKIAAGTWTNLDVTAAISGNGIVSFGLSTTSSTAVSLSSREGLHPPQLVVVSSGSGQTSSPTIRPSDSPTNPPTASPSPTPKPTSTTAATPTPAATPSPTAYETGSPGSATVTPAADSYVDVSSPASNFGKQTQVRFDGSPVVRTYLRFSVTGVTGTVTSAVLRVYANTGQTTGYDLYPVANNTWGETTITDANAPPFGATKLGSSGKFGAGTWTSVPVTAVVAGNGTYSFGLSTTNSTAVSLSSREGANPPQLVITWTGGAAMVAPGSPSRADPWPAAPYILLPLLGPGLLLLRRRPVPWPATVAGVFATRNTSPLRPTGGP
jgi:acid phosphatase type 7